VTGAELKAARLALGLSQRGLAERLGVPQATIWRWEAGKTAVQQPRILRLALERLAQPA
jgi:transcriptional regulator with XRE-family HTH domain